MPQRESPALKGLSIFTLYLIYLFDIASIVIVLVIFSTLLLDPNSRLVAHSMSTHMRNTLLGFLFAAYPLTQFLGAPILGELSDRLGRRLILNISTLATTFTYFLTALSILNFNLPLLFLSRLLGGFFAGNASLAQATVSGLVAKKNRSKSMALFTVVGGFAWIIGPFMGSFLSNPKIVSWFSAETPFWFLGFIFFLCWGLFMVSYQCMHVKNGHEKLSIAQCFKNLTTIFNTRIIIAPFIASLLAMFGWMIVQNFFAPFLMQKFSYEQAQVGYIFAYLSFWWLLGGLFSMFLFRFIKPSKLITLTTITSAIFVFVYVLYNNPSFFYWAAAIANFAFSISLSSFMALFAHLLPEEMHGRLYGTWVGGFALANTLAPALAGWISFLGINVPFLIASVVILIAGAIYLSWQQRHQRALKNYES